MKFEIYSKEELQAFHYRDLLFLYNERMLIDFISKKINITVIFDFNKRLRFDEVNPKFVEEINDSDFKKLFKSIIKDTYIEPYKTAILKLQNPEEEISAFSNQLFDYRQLLTKYRLDNKVITNSQYDFQGLLSYVLKQLNKLELYLIQNVSTKQEKELPESESSNAENDKSKTKVNPYPNLFKKTQTYYQFKEYTSKYIESIYVDYSYLFGKLKREDLIHHHTAKQIFEWLEKEQIINSDDIIEFYKKEKFRTFSKSKSVNREKNFTDTFK